MRESFVEYQLPLLVCGTVTAFVLLCAVRHTLSSNRQMLETAAKLGLLLEQSGRASVKVESPRGQLEMVSVTPPTSGIKMLNSSWNSLLLHRNSSKEVWAAATSQPSRPGSWLVAVYARWLLGWSMLLRWCVPSVRANGLARRPPPAVRRYLIFTHIEVLGSGGFGSAHLLQSRPSHRTGKVESVVVKVCTTELLGEEEAWTEMDILSSLEHPNVVRYYASWVCGAQLCLFMEFAAGGTLAARIEERRSGDDGPCAFSTEQVLRWLEQLCLALEYVHSQRVLHRDLKAANVFLTEDASIKLGDFGTSRTVSTQSAVNTVIGTPYYMAPEVLQRVGYGAAADTWSLGVILFELLTLKRPFGGAVLAVLIAKIASGNYDAAALESCTHSDALKQLASKEGLLHPDPNSVFQLTYSGSPLDF